MRTHRLFIVIFVCIVSVRAVFAQTVEDANLSKDHVQFSAAYIGGDMKFMFITDDDKAGQDVLVNRFEMNPGIIVYLPTGKGTEVGLKGAVRPTIVLVDRDGKVAYKQVGFSGPSNMKIARDQFEKIFTPKINSLL